MAWVEVGVGGQPLEVANENAAVLMVDHARFAERLECSVHMDTGQAERIGEHLLGDRHFATLSIREASRIGVKISQKKWAIREAAVSRLLGQPFTKGRRREEWCIS